MLKPSSYVGALRINSLQILIKILVLWYFQAMPFLFCQIVVGFGQQPFTNFCGSMWSLATFSWQHNWSVSTMSFPSIRQPHHQSLWLSPVFQDVWHGFSLHLRFSDEQSAGSLKYTQSLWMCPIHSFSSGQVQADSYSSAQSSNEYGICSLFTQSIKPAQIVNNYTSHNPPFLPVFLAIHILFFVFILGREQA